MSARVAARPPSCPDDPTERELIACTLDSMPEQPPAQFVIERILPRRHVTLLSGHGGSGKSTLALTLAAHVACGVDWGGLHVELGHVAFVTLEDEAVQCAWRLHKIAATYGLSVEWIARNLVLLDGTQADAALAAEHSDYGYTHLVPTPAMAELVAAAKGASLVVVDNASDALLGDANSQATVRTFMRRMLGKLARETDCAVLLLAHIDKHAARVGGNGQNFIGSVSWHNSARSRLALIDAPGLGVTLAHEKSNLGRRIEAIHLAFTPAGILVPRGAPTAEAQQGQRTQQADALLACLCVALAQGQQVTLSRAGTATTQRQLDTLPGFPPELRGRAGRLPFWAAIDSLLKDRRVCAAPFINAQRKKRIGLTCPESDFAPLRPLRSSPTPLANGAPDRRTVRTSAPFDNGAQAAQTAQAIIESPLQENEPANPSVLEL